MTNPAVFWPAMLGVSFVAIGIITHRTTLVSPTSHGIHRVFVLGPVLVGGALAAFAGEHFTAATSLAQIVPKFMPGRVFIAYFVGVAHLAAALSFVTRRYVRVSSLCLALMFALFVVLMDFPGALSRPGTRILWSLVAREATFSMGALALYALVTHENRPRGSTLIATIATFWTACVLAFYGIENVLYSQFSPGVPATMPTAAWVPAPHILAYVTGAIMIICGLAMFVKSAAPSMGAVSGLLMAALTAGLYVPQFFIANNVADQVNAINFVFDTILFAGMLLIVGDVARLRIVHATTDWVARDVGAGRSEAAASV